MEPAGILFLPLSRSHSLERKERKGKERKGKERKKDVRDQVPSVPRSLEGDLWPDGMEAELLLKEVKSMSTLMKKCPTLRLGQRSEGRR